MEIEEWCICRICKLEFMENPLMEIDSSETVVAGAFFFKFSIETLNDFVVFVGG